MKTNTEKIKELESCMKVVQTEINNIKENQKENQETNTSEHLKIMAKIDKFIDSADNKYASKNVEKIMWWVGGVVGAIIISAIMYLIIK